MIMISMNCDCSERCWNIEISVKLKEPFFSYSFPFVTKHSLMVEADTLSPNRHPSDSAYAPTSISELEDQLKQAISLIKEKEQGLPFQHICRLIIGIDLRLAAEIGQTLVDENDRLKSEVLFYKEKTKSQPEATSESATFNNSGRSDEKLLHLEQTNYDLKCQIQELQSMLADNVRMYEGKLEKLQKGSEDARLELVHLRDENSRLQEDRDRFLEEKLNMDDLSKRSQAQLTNDQKQFVDKITELENELMKSSRELNTLSKAVEDERSVRCSLEKRCVLAEEQLEDYQQMKEQFDTQLMELNDCRYALTEAHEAIEALTLELELFHENEKANDGEDSGQKSLFNEVEDKRKMLEEQNKSLAHKHQHLMRAHVAQQSRMKSHISRLTQLSQNQSAVEKLSRLERTVGHLQSENRQLQQTITQLERQIEDGSFDRHLQQRVALANDANKDDDLVSCLKLRIDTLIEELDQLKKEIRTVNFMRLNDIEQNRKGEAKLSECQAQLDALRTANAELKFELDESIFKIQHLTELQKEENSEDVSIIVKSKPNIMRTPTKLLSPTLPKEPASLPAFKEQDKTLKSLPPDMTPRINNTFDPGDTSDGENRSPGVSSNNNVECSPRSKSFSNSNLEIATRSPSGDFIKSKPSLTKKSMPKKIHIRRENVNECHQQ